MSDLSDFKRIEHEPLKQRSRELEAALDQARAAGDRLAEIVEAECGSESAGTLCDAALREWRAALGVAETKQEPPRNGSDT